jgi:phosphatidylethanolamine/phosphatidyl-N-methylethanolamine N-methyltransferase
MEEAQPFEQQTRERVVFLQGFLKRPLQVGSIIPSSRFLERRIIDLAEVRSAQTIVELGAGVGNTARAILDAMPESATFLSIEINPAFCTLVRRIRDERLIVHCGSAEELRTVISQYQLPAPDAVVSGIPFSTMPRTAGSRILEAIWSVLAPRGRFVAYQVSSQVATLSRPILGPPRVEVELFNIPPIRLYRWSKPAS